MLVPDPKVVKAPRDLSAGEIALHIKQSSAKREYMVTTSKLTARVGLNFVQWYVQAGNNYWMILDKHMTDFSGTRCNKIGTTYKALKAMEQRCYRKEYT